MGNLLFIDATIRSEEESRTWELCQAYLDEWKRENPEGTVEHLRLRDEDLRPCLAEDIRLREELLPARYPLQFAKADGILIGAPYWDLSFPSLLRVYLEKVCTPGVAFCYTEEGVKPLCRASDCVYLSACGGDFGRNLGAEYVHELCRSLFGIKNFYQAGADGLDIEGNDVLDIMARAKDEIRKLARGQKKKIN